VIAAAYQPSSVAVLAATSAALAAIVLLGFGLTRLPVRNVARACAWGLVLLTAGAAHVALRNEPDGFRLLAIVGGVLLAMKAVVAVESARGWDERSRLGFGRGLGFGRWLGFALLWFGMRPRIFEAHRSAPRDAALHFVRRGLVRLALGALLVAAARVLWLQTESRLLATLVLLPGLSLMFHFGLFNLLTGFWRSRGVDANELFRAPLLSESLEEFWSRRWNVGFSEMTAVAVYRPVRSFGRRTALVASFLFSGLLHELAISVPVDAGYGLPLLYFALQAIAVPAEAALRRRGHLGGIAGRVWTMLWIVLPTPLLFHRPFLAGVIWPLVGIA
jgi:alginate O-acetyltransferase complex protein AlgI